jgi:hypothetical protein
VVDRSVRRWTQTSPKNLNMDSSDDNAFVRIMYFLDEMVSNGLRLPISFRIPNRFFYMIFLFLFSGCLFVYYTGSLQSMATVKYLENGFLEILEIWYGVKSI